MLYHKHLLLNLKVARPPRDATEVESFLTFLIKRVDMQIAVADTLPKNPMAFYCDITGNQGATGTGILVTSHTALHTWDSEYPAKFDFDLYSCSDFDVENVLTLLQSFDIIEGNYVILDRNADIQIVEQGTIGENGTITQRSTND